MKPYRRTYPPRAPNPLALVVVGLVLLAVVIAGSCSPDTQALDGPRTFEGKNVVWWAYRAKQARRDANARAGALRLLRRTLRHDPSVQESIRLATVAYPSFTEARAWQIIVHESWMVGDPVHALNRSSGASGLMQFLPSTFASTPYGRAGLSIWSPYAQLLAAGYLHQLGQGCVHWKIGRACGE